MSILIAFVIFVIGFVLGGLTVLKIEENTLTTMLNQCASIAELERELREERLRYQKPLMVPNEGCMSSNELEEDYDVIYD